MTCNCEITILLNKGCPSSKGKICPSFASKKLIVKAPFGQVLDSESDQENIILTSSFGCSVGQYLELEVQGECRVGKYLGNGKWQIMSSPDIWDYVEW